MTTSDLTARYIVPSYGRFPLALARGEGTRVWDETGAEYLDFGAGIAVCSLGHCHPAITRALQEQAGILIHTSNLYQTRPQGLLAQHLVEKVMGGQGGKIFFANSGAEANEGLYKLARKFGHSRPTAQGRPRTEIITCLESFHGRTLAGIAATGQPKFRDGFAPDMPGFRYVPYNDADALRAAVSDETAAILFEVIQGEGGIRPVTPTFARAARELREQHDLLVMFDDVQAGLGRTGDLRSWHSVLPPADCFEPDAVSWAKGLGGGFPIGAFWASERAVGDRPLCDLLGPGTHASTFGGTPLGSAVALAVLQEIERAGLCDHALQMGHHIRQSMAGWDIPVLSEVRGQGLMLGLDLDPAAVQDTPGLAGCQGRASLLATQKLMSAGLLTVPSGERVVRLLPPLNVSAADVDAALSILRDVLTSL